LFEKANAAHCRSLKEVKKENEVEDVTPEMLEAAVSEAVHIGLLPKFVNEEEYTRGRERLRRVLEAAFHTPHSKLKKP